MEDIRKGVCPLCRHNKVLEAPATILMGLHAIPVTVGVLAGNTLRSLRQWFARTNEGRSWKDRLSGNTIGAFPGQLLTFSCRSCGFTQAFVRSCEEVPVGPEHRTRVLEGPSQEPGFR